MSDKPITWSQGVAVVGGAFGLCCMGFMMLHGLIIATRVEAAENMKVQIDRRNVQIASIMQDFKDYQKENTMEHSKIMEVLMSIRKAQ